MFASHRPRIIIPVLALSLAAVSLTGCGLLRRPLPPAPRPESSRDSQKDSGGTSTPQTNQRSSLMRTPQIWSADTPVTGLRITVAVDDFTMRAANVGAPRVSYYDYADDPLYTFEVRDGILVVEQKERAADAAFAGMDGEDVVIEVPRDMLDRAEIAVGTGDIDIENVSVVTLDAASDTGDADVQNVVATTCKLSAGTGDVDAEWLDATNLTFAVGTGDVDAQLAGARSEYRISLSGGMGTSNIDNQAGSGARTLDIEVGMGDIEVMFAR